MDSLLASYGSDSDSDATPHNSPSPLHRSSLFASLPPPKLSNDPLIPSLLGKPRSTASEEEFTSIASGVPPPPQLDVRESTRTSLFSALPPPKSVGSAGPPKVLPAVSGSKRVVEFRPPVNKALVEDPDDDDEPKSKRRFAENVAVQGEKLSGLAAILPQPKNLGTTLGGGTNAGGRRANLETFTDGSINHPALETGSLESAPVAGTSENFGHSSGENPQINADPYDWNTGSTVASHWHDYNTDFTAHESTEFEGSYFRNGGVPVNSYQETMASNVEDPIASIMMKEKRRGKEAPPNIIEIKQADLTANKVREDQLRVTGIAFGPAYRPSSDKNKPTKLHRRKHQIGSLYFDMKQKEMELLERRAKGNLTKSQTQGKYGW